MSCLTLNVTNNRISLGAFLQACAQNILHGLTIETTILKTKRKENKIIQLQCTYAMTKKLE